MSNIYEKSLSIMEEHLDYISDEEFLHNYLSVEENQGLLAKDFLFSSFVLGNGYTVSLELPSNEHITREENSSEFVSVDYEVGFQIESQVQRISCSDSVSSIKHSSSYSANDKSYMLVA